MDAHDEMHVFRGACIIYFDDGDSYETSPYGVVTLTAAGAVVSDNALPRSFIPAWRLRLIEAKNQ